MPVSALARRTSIRTLAAVLCLLAVSVRAQAAPPTVGLRIEPATVDEGAVVALEAEVDVAAAGTWRYAWDFGDGTGLPADPRARLAFHAFDDDGDYDVVVRVEDLEGRVAAARARVRVRNVAPVVHGVERDGAAIEGGALRFRARAFDPGVDPLTYTWDFGDGTVVGPRAGRDDAEHSYARDGTYRLELTVDDGDGGRTTWSENLVVGSGFRFALAGAVDAADGRGVTPYLTGVPFVMDGDLPRFAGELGAALRGDPAAAAGASCLVSFGSHVVGLASLGALEPVVRFVGVFPDGLSEGTYPVEVVANELPIRIYDGHDRERAAPGRFFIYLGTATPGPDGFPHGREFHGSGGTVTVHRFDGRRLELSFAARLEETFGALDLVDGPGGRSAFPPAPTAEVSGSFAHAVQRSLTGAAGSLNPVAGGAFGDWYLCAPRGQLWVETTTPAPPAATDDPPLVDFRDPEVTVRFDEALDLGSAVGSVVLEWRRADGNFEEVPVLVMGEGGRTLRIAPLDDLMDGVVYRARVVGGLDGVAGQGGQALEGDDVTWTFETILDLGEERHGVTLATVQVATDAPLVAGKATLTRVFLNWREKPWVHPEWQTRYATFDVAVDGADYASKRVRVKRYDLYAANERKHALDSVNFFGWRPGPGAEHPLTARVTQAGQGAVPRSFTGRWAAAGHGPAPALVFDYYFLRVGSWTDGVPVEARALGHRIARGGETFTAQNFPVPDVIARYRGDVAIAEPAEPLIEAFGEQFFLASLATATRRDEDAVDAFVERLGASEADVVVALLPPDVLRLSGFHYAVAGGSPRVVGVQISPDFAESDAYFASTLAHEIGHAFGLHHATVCPEVRPCVNGGQSDAIDGFRIASSGDFGWNKSAWSGNAEVDRTPGSVLSLMHPANLPDVAAFVTNEQYLQLQGAIRALGAGRAPVWSGGAPSGGLQHVQEARRLGLSVEGWIDAITGEAILTRVVPATGSVDATAPAAAATLELRALGAGGLVLARAAVAPQAADPWHPTEGGERLQPFRTFLAAGAGVEALVLSRAGRVVAERRGGSQAPTVAFASDPVVPDASGWLSWTASDADGDDLAFDLAYAPDGVGFRPLALDLRVTGVRIDPLELEPGSAPTLRLVARDGLRAVAVEAAIAVDPGPRVLAVDPAEGATLDPRGAVTVWTLGSLAVAGDAAGDAALVIERLDRGGVAVERISGRVAILGGGRGVRFEPSAPLAAGATYRASFGGAAPPHVWTFRSGDGPPALVIAARELVARPLQAAAEPAAADGAGAATSGPAGAAIGLPETCAGLARERWARLIPEGTEAAVGEADGACRIAISSTAAPEALRSFAERAIVTGGLFLTSNRSDAGVVTIGFRAAGLTGEARLTPGSPHPLTWTLRSE